MSKPSRRLQSRGPRPLPTDFFLLALIKPLCTVILEVSPSPFRRTHVLYLVTFQQSCLAHRMSSHPSSPACPTLLTTPQSAHPPPYPGSLYVSPSSDCCMTHYSSLCDVRSIPHKRRAPPASSSAPAPPRPPATTTRDRGGRVTCEACGETISFASVGGDFTLDHWDAHRLKW